MKFITITDKEYPPGLKRRLGNKAPVAIAARGDTTLLNNRILAIFCSHDCPSDLIYLTSDMAKTLREHKITVTGGFYSPVEQEVLAILLRGRGPIIVCAARSLKGMVLPPLYRKAMLARRLLLLSPFPSPIKLAGKRTRVFRNRLAAALADAILATYAAPGGLVEKMCREAVQKRQSLYTLASPYNQNLLSLGAVLLKPENLTSW